MFNLKSTNSKSGLTFVEVIVGVSIFLIVSISLYRAYIGVIRVVEQAQIKVLATALANEELEIARNLPYTDVGISGGIPLGKLLRDKTVVRDSHSFDITLTVRNVDDPFDGTIGGNPNDLSPADYKIVQVDIACPDCRGFGPISITTNVAPKNLETASDNGALFVRAINASGGPIQDANVSIINNTIFPSVNIQETTDSKGWLKIVDVPPAAESYEIIVTKSSYTTDMSYPPGAPENPNPTRAHSTVLLQEVTQTSFIIDKVSSIEVSTLTETCSPVANVGFRAMGSKLIGTAPDILKYDQMNLTNGVGNFSMVNLDGDTYSFLLEDSTYDLSGATPISPLELLPDSVVNLGLTVETKNPNSLLVSIRDSGSGLPISDASVTLTQGLDVLNFFSGRGALGQTDWSGGDGQIDFVDSTMYFAEDGNIEQSSPVGDITLREILGVYPLSGELESSTFDLGSTANFHQLDFNPKDQPIETGAESVRIQIATNNDDTTWDFLGPDGTADTYYSSNSLNINDIHDGDRYLRYKIFLSTEDENFTPNVSDLSFTFTTNCVPPGQVFFSGLGSGDYDLLITKSGYLDYFGTTTISSGWQSEDIMLITQ